MTKSASIAQNGASHGSEPDIDRLELAVVIERGAAVLAPEAGSP